MSPRFERRPSKRTGTGGRGPARPAPRGRQFGSDGPRGGDRLPDRGSDRGDRAERRSFDSRGDQARGRFPERGERPFEPRGDRVQRGSQSRGNDRSNDRGGERWGSSDRSDSPRFKPRRSDGERPRAPFRAGGSRRPSESRSSWSADSRPERGSYGGGERGRWRDARPGPSRFSESRPRSFPPVVVDRDRAEPGTPMARDGAERHGEPQGDDQPTDLIWGRHAAQAALESGRPIHRIWCTPELRFSPKFLQALREAKASGVLVEEVTWARLGQLTGGAVHQGIVLQPAAADTLDLASLIEGCRGLDEPPLLMALDGITDPHNLGAIARSAEALGAHGLVLPQRRSAGLTGSVAKVAAGALEHLPVARVVNLNRALDALKEEGYRVVGLAAEGSVSLAEADLDGPLVIVTGSEGDGLSMLTRKHCDQLVSIPLRGATPSLNASVATAMVLYEVARRGWMKDLKGGQPAPRIQRPQFGTGAPASQAAGEAPFMPAEALSAVFPPVELPLASEHEPAPEGGSAPQAESGSALPFSAFPVAEQASAANPGTMDSTPDSTP